VNWPPRPAGWRAGASTTARGASPTWATTLYCHQSHCLRVRAQQADCLFTCKPASHATLYEWVGDFERNEQLGRVVQARRVGKKHFTDTYRYAHQVQ
jgi:hypothetical protein